MFILIYKEYFLPLFIFLTLSPYAMECFVADEEKQCIKTICFLLQIHLEV